MKTNQAALKKLMASARLTQRETAYVLGVNITTVQRWLANPSLKSSRKISSRNVDALAYALQKCNNTSLRIRG